MFKENELIIYQCGDRYEIGKIKRIVSDGAFVWYNTGCTASKTPFDKMHKLENAYCVTKTKLGELFFDERYVDENINFPRVEV